MYERLRYKKFSKNDGIPRTFGGFPRYSPRGRLGFAEGKDKSSSVLRAHPSPRGFGWFPKNLKVKRTLHYFGNLKYKYKVRYTAKCQSLPCAWARGTWRSEVTLPCVTLAHGEVLRRTAPYGHFAVCQDPGTWQSDHAEFNFDCISTYK